jgi:hypothetical protein
VKEAFRSNPPYVRNAGLENRIRITGQIVQNHLEKLGRVLLLPRIDERLSPTLSAGTKRVRISEARSPDNEFHKDALEHPLGFFR